MKQTASLMLLMALGLLALACSRSSTTPAAAPGEELVRTSHDARPGWIDSIPEDKGDTMFFVGLSDRMASERLGRERARRDAMNNAVQFMGTLVTDRFEELSVDFGLQSDVVDPTISAREFNRQLAMNLVTHLKAAEYYWEQWSTPTGYGFQVYTLATIPKYAMDEAFKQSAAEMARQAARRAKQESDAVAKEQLEKASEMWKKMEQDGFIED